MIRSIKSIIIVLVAAVIALAAAACSMMRESHHAYINGRQLAMGAALLVFVVPVMWAVAALAK